MGTDGRAASTGHPYKEGYSVGFWHNAEQLCEESIKNTGISHDEALQMAEELQRLWHLGEVDDEARSHLVNEIRSVGPLSSIEPWIAHLHQPIILTEVGKMIALVNLKRLAYDITAMDGFAIICG